MTWFSRCDSTLKGGQEGDVCGRRTRPSVRQDGGQDVSDHCKVRSVRPLRCRVWGTCQSNPSPGLGASGRASQAFRSCALPSPGASSRPSRGIQLGFPEVPCDALSVQFCVLSTTLRQLILQNRRGRLREVERLAQVCTASDKARICL